MKIKNCKWIKPQTVEDGKDGNLVIIENMNDIPFNIKRVYYIHSLMDSKAVRGCHSHKSLEQVMFCLNGSFELELNDGINREFYSMNVSSRGLYIICCLISFWGGMLGKYLKYKFNFQNNPIFILVIILFCCLFSLNSLRDTKAILNDKSKLELFSKEYDKRENHILKEKNAGSKKVVVEQLNHFIGGVTITQDSSFWVNECVSAYYGINVITK